MADEKKIIVDEDWKSQVAAEKAAFERKEPASPAPAAAAPAGGVASQEGQAPPYDDMLPPASFEMLITIFATEAMVGLGQLPHPMAGQPQADLAHAKYAIDMLEMISEKTKGNLDAGEEAGLRELLHQLRMAFVAANRPQPLAH